MNYGTDIGKKFKLELVCHPSARRLVLSYFRFRHPRMSVSRIMALKTDFCTRFDGEWKEARVRDLLLNVRRIGLWGYCHHVSKTHKQIHYWVGRRPDIVSVLELFAHELAHAIGYSSERTACRIAGIGALAAKIVGDDVVPNMSR